MPIPTVCNSYVSETPRDTSELETVIGAITVRYQPFSKNTRESERNDFGLRGCRKGRNSGRFLITHDVE